MVQQIARVRNLVVVAAAVLATTGITQAWGRQSDSPPPKIDVDRVCFAPQSVPLSWTIGVKPLDRERPKPQ